MVLVLFLNPMEVSMWEVGKMENGKWNGQGTYTWKDGSKFVGEWKDGKPWYGTQYEKDGDILGKYVNGNYRPINLF